MFAATSPSPTSGIDEPGEGAGPRISRLGPGWIASGLLAATAWICPAALAEAEESAPDSIRFRGRIPEVLIQAPRPATDVGGSAAVEARIDSLPVPAAATVEEVLREIPLLHVRTNSRGEAEISARGSESRQVAVLVDGIPITLAWDARADVSVIPATALQDVTFVRGLSSMLYGPNVLGGIVETRIAGNPGDTATPAAQVTMGTDDVGTYGTTVTGTMPWGIDAGRLVVRGGLGYRNSPGDPLARDVDEAVPSDDDLRLNTDRENLNGFLSGRFDADGGAWVALSGSSFKEERGIAAELGVADEDARLWRYPDVRRTLAVLSGGTGYRTTPWGRGDLEASVGIDRGRTDIDAYTTRAYDEIDTFENAKDRTTTFRLLGDHTLGTRSDLRAAFTLADIHHDEIVPEGTSEYQQRLWSVGVENVWDLLRGGHTVHTISLSLGGAYDVGETPKAGGRETQRKLDEWGGRLGLSAVLGNGRTVLHAGVSRRGRFPALRELYSGALNRFVPNPDLEPEKLLTTEAGITTRLHRGELQVVGFHNQLRDAVVRITLEDRRFLRVNRNELTSTGIELLGSHAFGSLVVSTDATFQKVDLKDTGSAEKHEPENLPEIFGSVRAELPVYRQVALGSEVAYTGSQFCIDPATGEDTDLDGEAVVHAYLSRTWPLRTMRTGRVFTQLETRLAVDNVGDVAVYDACGLPEPGRRVRFELRLR